MSLAKGIALAGLAFYLISGLLQAKTYNQMTRLSTMLIPDDQMPKSDKEATAQSVDLVTRYPHDPRALYFRAEALIDAHQTQAAEKELWAALNEKELLETYLDKKMELTIRGVLAGVLADEKRMKEAKEVAKPVCEEDPNGKMGKFLKAHGFCD
jgi:rhomboid protease GluP